MKKILLAMCLGLMLIVVAAPAQADPITYWSGDFTSDHCTGGCGTAPFGEVVLTLEDGYVHFNVSLNDDGSAFIRTGAGDGMNFSFNGTGVSLDDIVVPDGLSKAAGDFCHGDLGCFDFGGYFTDQTTGADPANLAIGANPIEFDVNGATIEDLIQLNDEDQIFVADIYSGQTGLTGLVDLSEGEEGFPPVPEPSTMILFGSGLLGLAVFSRMKRRN